MASTFIGRIAQGLITLFFMWLSHLSHAIAASPLCPSTKAQSAVALPNEGCGYGSEFP